MFDLEEKTINNFFCCIGLKRYMLTRFALMPVLSPSSNYSNSLFEGMSIIARDGRLGLFHPALNFERFTYGAESLCQKPLPYSHADMCGAIFSIAALNGWHRKIELKDESPEVVKAGKKVRRVYVRPLAYIDKNLIGFSRGAEYELLLGAVPMGRYLPVGKNGISVMLFPVARHLPFSHIKAASNYQLSIFSEKKLERFNRQAKHRCGEVIFRNEGGSMTEGGGENLMLVRGNELMTPPVSSGVLPGITLRIIAHIAERMGMEFRFADFSVSDLSEADALFFTGNAAGIVPIGQVVEVDSNYSERKVHRLRDGAENRFLLRLKREYEMLETFQKGEGMHAFMDEWIGDDEADRLFAIGEKFREDASLTYGKGYCTCTPFDPKPKWREPKRFAGDCKALLRQYSIRKYI